MTIYYPKQHYDSSEKGQLFPLIGFLEKKDEGKWKTYFRIVNTFAEAEIVILPMSWNYYHAKNKINDVINFITQVNGFGKKVYTYNAGDNGVKVPEELNIMVFRICGYTSQRTPQENIIPFFLTDPLQVVFDRKILFNRDFSNRPTVGFCGQVNSSKLNAVKEASKVIIKNILYYLGVKNDLPQKIQSTSFNRSKVLSYIENVNTIKSNFIRREKYRAGASTQAARQKTTLEYYQNMIDSDYIICIRGAGNFSVRLYETLAMGRIPVFINTDCILPMDDVLPWKEHMVWVEYDELDKLEALILAHYSSMNDEELNDLFLKNRKMWLIHMGMLDFFKNSFIRNEIQAY